MRLLSKFKRQLNILFLLCFTTTVLLVTVFQNKYEVDDDTARPPLNFFVSRTVGGLVKEKGEEEEPLKRKTYSDEDTADVIKLPYDFPNTTGSLWRPAPGMETDDDRILKQRQWIRDMAETKTFQEMKPKNILVLDGFYSYFGHKGGLNCPSKKFESKCKLTEDHWYTGMFRNFEEYDAVVSIRNWVYKIFESRLPTSRQVIFTVESPYVTRYADFTVNNALLASYWTGSDIVMPYGKWVAYDQSRMVVNNSNHNVMQKNYASGRTKLAFIVTSDCQPENRRLDYVRELQKYIQVDIYGGCGNLKCGPDCFDKLQKEYKFYLAFERANCRDYITEKFFHNALQHDLVPVVLGAHRKDYSRTIAPNSFIHVEDFNTPWDLSSYLLYLNEHDDEYNAYFAYKLEGEFVDPWKDFFCRICGLLIYEHFVPAHVWPSGSTWKKVNVCLDPGKWYWDR